MGKVYAVLDRHDISARTNQRPILNQLYRGINSPSTTTRGILQNVGVRWGLDGRLSQLTGVHRERERERNWRDLAALSPSAVNLMNGRISSRMSSSLLSSANDSLCLARRVYYCWRLQTARPGQHSSLMMNSLRGNHYRWRDKVGI